MRETKHTPAQCGCHSSTLLEAEYANPGSLNRIARLRAWRTANPVIFCPLHASAPALLARVAELKEALRFCQRGIERHLHAYDTDEIEGVPELTTALERARSTLARKE